MKFTKAILAGAIGAAMIVPAGMKAQEAQFMRNSIYTILVNSDEQNTRLDKEAQTVDPNGYAETLKSAGISSLGAIPKGAFPAISIPEQFNDHNLATRVIEFDQIKANVSADEAKAARPKGGGAGNFLKAAGGAALAANSGNSESSLLRVEEVDDYMHAVVQKYIKETKAADYMVAKWFDWNDQTKKFGTGVIEERGLQNASAADEAKAAANQDLKAMLAAQGFELLNNTYLVATNLRFRNNKAVAKEISDLAATAAAAAGSKFGGAAVGGLAKLGAQKATEAMVNGIMKDMYSVTAVTHLYKLDWSEEIDDALTGLLYKDGATLEDLLNTGKCHLSYVGQTKARAGVKKNKEKSLDQLASDATARAIDQALAKLQVENEDFRTKVPVSKCADGYVYAKIGTKEGLHEGDEYDVLEKSIDPKTQKVSYKKVATAKVEKDIWFNTFGGEDLIAEMNDKDAAAAKAAQELGYTKMKTGKKNDFSGYYLKLSKKKGKID